MNDDLPRWVRTFAYTLYALTIAYTLFFTGVYLSTIT